MSLVVAIEHKGRVYMGSDTQSTQGSHVRYMREPKMFKRDSYIIGYAGSLRSAQLIKQQPLPENINVLPEVLRICLKECDGVSHFGDEDGIGQFPSMGSYLLIGQFGKLYEVAFDFSLMRRIEPYGAIGEGRDYAFGYLYATDQMPKKFSPKTRIERAIKCGSYFCNSVGGEIVIDWI